jgi:hypothetical protein
MLGIRSDIKPILLAKWILLYAALMLPILSLGEGTKQLRPYYEANAHLVLMRTNAVTDQNNTLFAPYRTVAGFNDDATLRFRIGTVGEVVYIGFGRYFSEINTGIGDPADANPSDDEANVSTHNFAIPYTSPNLFYNNSKQLRFRIVDGAGTVVLAETPVPLPGQVGYIGDESLAAYNRAVAGAAQLVGATGYNAFAFTPASTGDFYVEFTIFDVSTSTYQIRKTSLQLFDLTVASAAGPFNVSTFTTAGEVTATTSSGTTGTEIPGRLWSRAWRLSTGNNYIGSDGTIVGFNGMAGSGTTNNVFVANMFPYSDDGVVTRMNFNGMDPFGFTVSCNQNGVSTGTDFVLTKRSIYTTPPPPSPRSPLYRIFLQNPDITQFPDGTVGCLRGVSIRQCALTGDMPPVPTPYCIEINANAVGAVDILIDLDPEGTNVVPSGDGIYTPGTRDVLISQQVLTDGTTCVPWNGLDGLGVQVPDGRLIRFKVNFRAGLTNLPIVDVEQQRNGLLVDLVRPPINACMDIIPPPKLYWDDTDVQSNVGTIFPNNAFYPMPTPTSFSAPSNLVGCNPDFVTNEGCHKWGNRGKNFGAVGLPIGYAFTQEMMNTWWFLTDVERNINHANDLSLFDITANLTGGNCVFRDGDDVFIDIQFSRVKFDPTLLSFSDSLPPASAYDLDSIGIVNYDVFPGSTPKRTIRFRYRLDVGDDGNYTTIPDSQLGLRFGFFVITNQCGSPQRGRQLFDCFVLLPVELTSFSGRAIDGQTTKLEWKTVTEKDNRGFFVERSFDGYNFSEIGFVQGALNSNSERSYQFLDKLPARGKFYYRLRQMDENGKETYSKIIAVTTDDLELDFMDVFYQQDLQQLQVRVRQSKAEDLQVSIYNMLGVEMQCTKINAKPQGLANLYTLSVPASAAGTYVVEVKDSRNVLRKKIILH